MLSVRSNSNEMTITIGYTESNTTLLLDPFSRLKSTTLIVYDEFN